MGAAQEKVVPETVFYFKAAPAPAEGKEAKKFFYGFAETMADDQISIILHNVEVRRGAFAMVGGRFVGRIVGLKLETLKFRKQDVAVFKCPAPRPAWFGVAAEPPL
jgi:hypothetical protein